MRSDEVLKQAADVVGVKVLAADLRLSTALVYKWCQEWDPNDPDLSGARNPLDRVADIVRITGDSRVINWLCHEGGGFFVPNPPTEMNNLGAALLANAQALVNEFSKLLVTVTRSIEDDGQIEPSEAKKIRQSWELLKNTAETFTVGCERGLFYREDESLR